MSETNNQANDTATPATTPLADLPKATQTELEAAAFRRLVQHLEQRNDVQNIELMTLAGFCRNCLSKWYTAAAEEQGVQLDYEQVRERVYGIPYDEWKTKYQTPATPEQLAAYDQHKQP